MNINIRSHKIISSTTCTYIDDIVSFNISKDKQTIEVTELCDSYFEETLTKEEFASFIAELNKLHSQMKEIKS